MERMKWKHLNLLITSGQTNRCYFEHSETSLSFSFHNVTWSSLPNKVTFWLVSHSNEHLPDSKTTLLDWRDIAFSEIHPAQFRQIPDLVANFIVPCLKMSIAANYRLKLKGFPVVTWDLRCVHAHIYISIYMWVCSHICAYFKIYNYMYCRMICWVPEVWQFPPNTHSQPKISDPDPSAKGEIHICLFLFVRISLVQTTQLTSVNEQIICWLIKSHDRIIWGKI